MQTPSISRALATLGLLAVAGAAFAAGPAASAASAPTAAPSGARQITPGNRQHQLLARCSQQVDAQGLTGPARKQAIAACLRAS